MNRQAAVIGLCMLLGIMDSASGQDRISPPSADSLFAYQLDGNILTSNVYLNDLPSRAFRHFRKTYPTVTSERWMKTGSGYSAYFGLRDSVFYHVVYDRTGHFDKTLIYYAEGRVPASLQESMKYVYRNCQVLYTSEMDAGLKKIYQVMLTDGDNVKVVEIKDDDMKTVFEYRLDIAGAADVSPATARRSR